ncbi:MAG: YhbY family RNA-binding protein [Oscillospiraceae bacterium]|nr:YhbY family RNA-binding protein [Oscillospiraceae bacterium]
MLSGKQRAYLKGLASTQDTILHVGKNGVIETLTAQVNDALRARELIKMKVQDGCALTSREAARELAEKTSADIVQVIGSKFVLYKPNPKEPKITLPKAKQ